MAYAIAGRVREFAPAGYPTVPIVPHGMAVTAAAPAVFRAFGAFRPDRHAEAAALLGADVRGVAGVDTGALLAERVAALARDIGVPVRISDVGYTAADIDDLVAGTLPQQRLLGNAPCEVDAACLAELFRTAL
jgi:hydroxyacid-oxoacid transhydrogenase